jgi:cold shock CspA family protein
MESGLCKGKLTKWNDKRGFGFIQPEDKSQEIFLHISELKDLTRRPQVGDIICYHAEKKDGKLRAYNAFILRAKNKSSLDYVYRLINHDKLIDRIIGT